MMSNEDWEKLDKDEKWQYLKKQETDGKFAWLYKEVIMLKGVCEKIKHDQETIRYELEKIEYKLEDLDKNG